MTVNDFNIIVNVSDLSKSIALYQSIEFELKNRWGNYYAQLTAAGFVIGLHPSSQNNLIVGSGNGSIGVTILDLEETTSHLQNSAIHIKERNEEGRQFLHI